MMRLRTSKFSSTSSGRRLVAGSKVLAGRDWKLLIGRCVRDVGVTEDVQSSAKTSHAT